MAAPTPVGVETRPTGGWLTWDFGLEGGVAELHGFEDDVFDGAACRNHGENVLGVGNHDIEYIGGFGSEEALEGGADFFGFGDALSGYAEALADGEVIRKNSFWRVGIAEESVASVTSEEAIFPLYDHSEVLVIDDDGFGGNIFGDSGGQFLDVHEERAVAVDIDNFAMGAGDFGPEGGRVSVAHGAEPC